MTSYPNANNCSLSSSSYPPLSYTSHSPHTQTSSSQLSSSFPKTTPLQLQQRAPLQPAPLSFCVDYPFPPQSIVELEWLNLKFFQKLFQHADIESESIRIYNKMGFAYDNAPFYESFVRLSYKNQIQLCHYISTYPPVHTYLERVKHAWNNYVLSRV
jgi:hypothetical protein